MKILRNFTIRVVMLTILGVFCLMWLGVGLYSTWSLSRVAEGNEVDRHLVRQMTVLSQGNDQYFRFVTRLSRAGGNCRQHGAAYRNGEAECGQCPPGQPAYGYRLTYRQ